MNRERLLKLAVLLESDAKNPNGARFDLETWASNAQGEADFPSPRQFKKLDCNTQACAVGLACLSGIFKKDGLRWTSAPDENNIVPRFKGKDRFEAVEAFFDINERESRFLFVAAYYTRDDLSTAGAEGEIAAAKRIRRFVEGTAKAPH